MRAGTLRRLINLWPPFLFNSVHVLSISEDWSKTVVRLKLRFWNRNYVGTQFGGNLFAMGDPWWMLMTMHRLGKQYLVWDKAGAIEFVAPGKGDVFGTFELSEEAVQEMRAAAADGSKVVRWFETEMKTRDGTVVARVRKQIYVRLKRAERPGEEALNRRAAGS